MERLLSWSFHGRRFVRRIIPLGLVVLFCAGAATYAIYRWTSKDSWLHGNDPIDWVSFIKLPRWLMLGLLLAVAMAFLTRRVAVRSAEGPIVVGDVLDSDRDIPIDEATGGPAGGPAGGPTGRAATVAAILRHRLSLATRHGGDQLDRALQGIIPSVGGVDLDGDGLAAAAASDTYGWLTRAGLGVWRSATTRQGWRVRATLRYDDDSTSPHGLSYVVEHVATRRIDVADVVWAATHEDAAREAAYRVAAWYLRRENPPSTRRSPNWRPSAASLRDYQDAEYHASRRRFDEAVECAQRSLDADPSNFAARRLLGETYEWLGHFENAIHTYATGIVALFDLQNGWSVTALGPDDDDHPRRGWPLQSRAAPLAARQASRLPGFRDGLVWRYVVVLRFTHQWLNRWVYVLERAEEQRRLKRPAATHADPAAARVRTERRAERGRWARETVAGGHSHLRRLTDRENDHEQRMRQEQGKRLRGFMHRRYAALLGGEFPLLEACWFAELHDRQSPFGTPLRAISNPPPTDPGDRVGTVIDSQTRRIPIERGGRQRRGGLRPPPAGPVDLDAWVAELAWLFTTFLSRWLPDDPPAVPLLTRGIPPTSMVQVVDDACRRLGVSPSRTAPEEILEALADPDAWNSRELDRQLIGAVASWLANQALRIASDADASPAERARLLRIASQLDLASFFDRCTLYELDRSTFLQRLRQVLLLPECLQDLMWLIARFSYIDRQYRIARVEERSYRRVEDNGQTVSDEGRLDPHGPWEKLRIDTAAAAREVSRRRQQWRRLAPAANEWSLWYYAACVHARVIAPPPPEPADPSIHDPAVANWKRRYDPIAEFAVRALNQSILVRGRKGLTLIEAGTQHWMLYEDPDLDNLRRHPRFQRWACATFALDSLEYGRVEQCMKAQVEVLEAFEWSTEGIYGTTSRWGSWSRRWWVANDTLLARSVLDVAPRISRRLRRAIPAAVAAPNPSASFAQAQHPKSAAALDPTALQTLQVLVSEEHAAWRALAGYRRFAARLDLRLRTARILDHLADGPVTPAAFPTYASVQKSPHPLTYQTLDDTLERLLAEVLLDERNLASAADSTPQHLQQTLAALLDRGARRWESLHAVVQQMSGR